MTTTPTLSGPAVTFSFDPLAFGPKITPLANGTFTIAWDSNSPNSDIFARHFNERGGFTGGDFLSALSSADPKSLSSPRLYQQANGKVRVIYQELSAPGDNDIFLHVPDSQNFTPQTNSFPIENFRLDDVLIDGTPLTTGGGAILYTESVGLNQNLVLRAIDSFGNQVSNQIFVGAHPGEVQQNGAITSVRTDRVLVAYEDVNQTTFARDIRLHTYASNGTDLSGEVFVSAPNVNAAFPDVVTLRDQINSVVAWQQNGGIAFRRYSVSGSPLDATPLFVPNSAGGFVPKIAPLKNDGGFIIAWTAIVGRETDGSPDLDVLMQRFDAAGTPIGTQVDIHEPGDQGLLNMDIATLADGRVILAYNGETGDSTNITTLNYRIVDPRDSNIFGTNGDDNIVGREDASVISSGDGNDKVTGRDGNDTLNGGAGNDTLNGGAGNDLIEGGNSGNDVLVGGAGSDRFKFGSPDGIPNSTPFGGTNADTINDFIVGIDKIVLHRADFSALQSPVGGNLLVSEFAIVTSDNQAGISKAKIVYNSVNGNLFYNPDGATSGFGAGGQFATLIGSPNNLSATDLLLD